MLCSRKGISSLGAKALPLIVHLIEEGLCYQGCQGEETGNHKIFFFIVKRTKKAYPCTHTLLNLFHASSVFLVACHADIFREMVLLARGLGMPQGEYVFIYFTNMPGDRLLGDYSWKRGDELDLVST